MTIPIWLYVFSVAISAYLGFTLCIMIGLVEFYRELDRLIKKYQLPRTARVETPGTGRVEGGEGEERVAGR